MQDSNLRPTACKADALAAAPIAPQKPIHTAASFARPASDGNTIARSGGLSWRRRQRADRAREIAGFAEKSLLFQAPLRVQAALARFSKTKH